eukprot:7076061-Pyramimonas_sp.AAC.1
MIGNPAVVVGVKYSVTFSIRNLLVCCQADTSVQDMKYGSFLVKHEIYFAFAKPIFRKAYGSRTLSSPTLSRIGLILGSFA